jgi:hypothetical protein
MKAIFILSTSIFLSIVPTKSYDKNYVEISSVIEKGYTYNMVYMDRGGSGNRIKAKYFAGKGSDGKTVPTRYNEWSSGKNVIVVSSAGYMTDLNPSRANPVGLSIDNGRVINSNIADFDALVIVYATGGVVATNLKEGNLTLQGGGIAPGRKFDLRKNSRDLIDFIDWAKSQEATVFQTHLLAYKDELKIGKNAEPTERERRFLAVGKDKGTGNLCHIILNLPEYTTLYDGAIRAKQFLNDSRDFEITFMVNFDTGGQDVCELYNSNGTINQKIKGASPLTNAVNLLAYYYE